MDSSWQFGKLESHRSGCLDIACGVHKGSVLGHKLFILCINDTCEIFKCLKLVNFADYTFSLFRRKQTYGNGYK